MTRTNALSRFAISFTAATALAGGLVAGTSSAAQAASEQRSGGAVTLNPTDAFTIPTWIFQKTEVCVINGGAGAGRLKVRSQSGADPEYIEVERFFQRACISRWWGGFPVDLRNEGSTALSVSYQ